jgi:hypothetical protein
MAKPKHKLGKINHKRFGYGVSARCSCGKPVRSTGNDETLWRAFDKHVKRATEKEKSSGNPA